MPSGLSKPSATPTKRRVPQQDRGERRVAEVLEAAAAVFVEAGYETATMTAIAERAGASIGAVYQYFPNKEAIVRALRHQYADEIESVWSPLAELGTDISIAELVDRIFGVMVEFMERRPAYIPLLSAPRTYARDPAARHRLRALFAALFRERQPALSAEEALRVANVTVQVVKGMNPLYAAASAAERVGIVREFKLVLLGYLTSRLQ